MTEAGQLTVGVVGAGTMGVGIAVVAARAGHRTLVCDRTDDLVAAGIGRIRAFLDRSVELGKLGACERDAATAALSGTTELAGLFEADVVIEAVYEDLATKVALMEALDAGCGPTTVLHTNTSTLSVTSIAGRCANPGRVIGTHYCNPAPLMPLVEVVDGLDTDAETHRWTMEFVRSLGKSPVAVRDTPGFIVNRFLVPFENDCIRALDAGLGTVESIDKAVKLGLHHPMGPFTLLDVVGLDIHRAVSLSLYEQLREPRFAPPPLVDRMISAGRLGRKTGRGFYRYADDRLFGA